jgi:predicted aldo/keto reductase-like oxidoreductase
MSDKKIVLSKREFLVGSAAVAAAAALGSPIRVEEAEAGKPKAKPVPQVPRRILGKTKQSIPILLFGAGFRLNGVFDPKLAEAMRYGVNYFDVADCYGGETSEAALASYHKRTKSRGKMWITSKSDEHDPKGFEARLDRSLKRLQTNHVDLYYLHALKDKAYLSKALEKKVAELKKAGKMKHFGFSCHHGNVVELMNLAATLPWIDSIMFRYNFRQYGNKALNKAIDACHKAGIGLIAMKTQGSAASFEPQWKKFRKKGKWNKHQAVLKAVWADNRITAAVSHMDTFRKLRENIGAAVDRTKLTQLEIQELKRYASLSRDMACDGCEHICNATIPTNVQIGTTLRYLMYHDVYGQTQEAKALFASLPADARSFQNIDFSAAQKACPHNLDIDTLLKRAGIVLV